MAPECFDPSIGGLTTAADVYSFGVLLWEILTGEHPWSGKSNVAIIYKVAVQGARLALPGQRRVSRRTTRNSDIPGAGGALAGPLASIASDTSVLDEDNGGVAAAAVESCPVELRELIRACFAHRPHERPSAMQVVSTLERLIAEEQRVLSIAASASMAATEGTVCSARSRSAGSASTMPMQNSHVGLSTSYNGTMSPVLGGMHSPSAAGGRENAGAGYGLPAYAHQHGPSPLGLKASMQGGAQTARTEVQLDGGDCNAAAVALWGCAAFAMEDVAEAPVDDQMGTPFCNYAFNFD